METSVREINVWADAFGNAGTEYLYENGDETLYFEIKSISFTVRLQEPVVYPSRRCKRLPPKEVVAQVLREREKQNEVRLLRD